MLTPSQKRRTSEMARAMREHGDGCNADHLRLKGFTQHEIDTLGTFATEEANATFARAA
ncbi:hypothetical protein IB238_05515 [Rhizobium sp. ARZ01]|uniref:hypothetical protein n=1 Tax=Rhizobium sp. ARZ01 TaxID=2769313 RepID=UPI001783DDC2|nr:hypothetical protein [Rhizobium sp. ARZ01]MBD9372087.1 hypothetical protein [Rhizobium sp. ARZ01]